MTGYLIASSVMFFVFNYSIFNFAKKQYISKELDVFTLGIMFFLQFIILCGIDYYGASEAITFCFFLLLQLLQYRFFFWKKWRYSIFATFSFFIFIVSIQTILRSIVCIALDVSLYMAAHQFQLKIIINMIATFIASILIRYFHRIFQSKDILSLCMNYENLTFVNRMIVLIGFYLIFNTHAYFYHGTSFFIKFLQAKVGICALAGYFIVVQYGIYMSRLQIFASKSETMRQEISLNILEEEKLKNIAYRDELTGCFSRAYCKDAFISMTEKTALISVCFIDLDGLKYVNDTWGHLTGDEYITNIVNILRNVIGEEGILARIGGDEFIILMPDRKEEYVEKMMQQAVAATEKINASAYQQYLVSFSYGILEYNKSKGAVTMLYDEVVQEADHRMYLQKKQKKLYNRKKHGYEKVIDK